MDLASLPLEKSAARNVTAERSANAGKFRKLGLRSAHWAMKSGIQGIDCMNGDPDNDAQAMAMSRAKTPSKAASLMVCIGYLKRRGAGAELKGQIFFWRNSEDGRNN